MLQEQLILALEKFAAERGISPSTVTSRVVGNSRLYLNMKNGRGSCTLDVADRLYEHMGAAAPGND